MSDTTKVQEEKVKKTPLDLSKEDEKAPEESTVKANVVFVDAKKVERVGVVMAK